MKVQSRFARHWKSGHARWRETRKRVARDFGLMPHATIGGTTIRHDFAFATEFGTSHRQLIAGCLQEPTAPDADPCPSE